MLSGYNGISHPNINNDSMKFIGPCFKYLFGTDSYGDNLWNVVWIGARNSLGIAGLTTLITITLGVTVGSIWGYSKSMDKWMIEIYNIIANVPFTLIVFVMMYILGRGFWQLIFAMSVTSWLGTAYFIRTQVMIIRDREVFLAWLGIGVGESTPSLGKTISANRIFMTNSGYLFWIPVAVSAIITVSLYVAGQTLADAADPRTHR